MSDQSQGAGAGSPLGAARARFNLSEFVIGYLEETGSVVMPPEFGVYEVLMPEEVADSLSLDDHTHLAFTGSPESSHADLRLSVNHPLVEALPRPLHASLPTRAPLFMGCAPANEV